MSAPLASCSWRWARTARSSARASAGAWPRPVLNVDLGASVTKLALCRGGEVRETAAIALGTRSLALDAAGRIVELRPAAARAAGEVGSSLESGAAVDPAAREQLARRLAD